MGEYCLSIHHSEVVSKNYSSTLITSSCYRTFCYINLPKYKKHDTRTQLLMLLKNMLSTVVLLNRKKRYNVTKTLIKTPHESHRDFTIIK